MNPITIQISLEIEKIAFVTLLRIDGEKSVTLLSET